ncbi:hypothetical protein BUALT_Bualt15G0046300 [Buddleja alternifolia]|uniref:Pathogenesis-related homeodomain protein n=1 Tax=Buddleja alternifolia TaxID=168488 RepID=A0AAV6WKB7_9LAMI|nr:hypothetical protein BUALT_Bualt15G0046300 [Buddleja alternifolia]
MEMMENGTQGLELNMTEKSELSENEAQNPNCTPPAPDNYKLDSERLVTVPVEQKEITGAQKIESILISIEETSVRSKEMEPSPGDNSDLGAEKNDPIFENVKISVAVENSEVASQNENSDIPAGMDSVNPGNGKLEPMQIGAATDSGQLGDEDKGYFAQPRKRKDKPKSPVSSSRVLRSRSQEKPKALAPNDSVKEDGADGEKKRSGRKKKQTKKNTANEFSRTRSHLRYLLHRIKYEQSLIDAYSAEGWRRQSVDKLKPEKELERAKGHILRYKLKIRELFQHLDTSLSVGKLPAALFDSEGEIDSEDIFCAKCGTKDLRLDNDIILCDGACERGFHQFCLDPPLLKEDIPPGDEGWLCPGCDCKLDCIDMLKDFQETKISILDSWEKIFPEAAAAASGNKLDDGSKSSSDDSEDDDYDPDKPDTVQNVEADELGDESSSDESNYLSASDELAASVHNENEKYLGLPSDDSEDDDFDPSAADQDKPEKEDSSSSDFTSDSEDLGALLGDDTVTGEDLENISPPSDHKEPSAVPKEENSRVGKAKRSSLKDELPYLMETSAEPVSGKRHVERLDYKKLLEKLGCHCMFNGLVAEHETYGNSSSDSSDEDFDDDITVPKRRKINREKTEVVSPNRTPTTKSEVDTKNEHQTESNHLPTRTQENIGAGGTSESSAKVGSASTGTKSAPKRLGEATTQRLYQSFNENQYPERAVKENLAKELGLTVRQVTKWFENARWSYNHRPRMESKLTEKPPEPQPTINTSNTISNQSVGPQESNPIATESHISETGVENLVTNTSGENSNSATRTSRKRKGKVDQPPNYTTVTNESKRQTRRHNSAA